MPAGRHTRAQGALLLAGLWSVGVALPVMILCAVRLWSVVLGLSLAWAAAAAPLFGASVGALATTLRKSLVRQPHAFSRLAWITGLASPFWVIALIQVLREKAVDKLDRDAIVRIVLLLVVTALPFSLLGAALVGALRVARGRVGTVLSVSAFGIGAGWLVAGPLVFALGAPRAGLCVALLLGLASVVFACGSLFKSGDYSPNEEPGGGWGAAAFFFSACSLIAGDYGEQWLTVPSIRFVNVERAHFHHFGPEAMVSVDRPARGTAWLRVEASQVSAVSDGKAVATKHPDELVFSLVGPTVSGRTLVTSAGGGRDLRLALAHPATEIIGLAPHRTLADSVRPGARGEGKQGR